MFQLPGLYCTQVQPSADSAEKLSPGQITKLSEAAPVSFFSGLVLPSSFLGYIYIYIYIYSHKKI